MRRHRRLISSFWKISLCCVGLFLSVGSCQKPFESDDSTNTLDTSVRDHHKELDPDEASSIEQRARELQKSFETMQSMLVQAHKSAFANVLQREFYSINALLDDIIHLALMGVDSISPTKAEVFKEYLSSAQRLTSNTKNVVLSQAAETQHKLIHEAFDTFRLKVQFVIDTINYNQVKYAIQRVLIIIQSMASADNIQFNIMENALSQLSQNMNSSVLGHYEFQKALHAGLDRINDIRTAKNISADTREKIEKTERVFQNFLLEETKALLNQISSLSDKLENERTANVTRSEGIDQDEDTPPDLTKEVEALSNILELKYIRGENMKGFSPILFSHLEALARSMKKTREMPAMKHLLAQIALYKNKAILLAKLDLIELDANLHAVIFTYKSSHSKAANAKNPSLRTQMINPEIESQIQQLHQKREQVMDQTTLEGLSELKTKIENMGLNLFQFYLNFLGLEKLSNETYAAILNQLNIRLAALSQADAESKNIKNQLLFIQDTLHHCQGKKNDMTDISYCPSSLAR